MLASTFLTLAGLVSLSTAGYVLEDDYSADSFFDMFDFFTGSDPTNGYVTYVDQSTAQNDGLISTNSTIYIGVDHTNVASGSGRPSVRLTSTKTYTHALIVLDVAHMPGGVCGTWPAFWTVGPEWPANGEIDIIEGVNTQSTNAMTLHTGAGCSITNNGLFSGDLVTPNCNVDASGQSTNAGCQITAPSPTTFGTDFNNGQGGIYATEWTSDAINIWFFSRGSIPSDISSGSPDPTGWGTATASFSGECDIDDFFMDHQIVFDNTFCGDWAGIVWPTDPVCSLKASTCESYVQNNPSDFVDAFWSINSLKVYTENGLSASSSAIPTASKSSSAVSIPIPTMSVSGFPSSIPSSLSLPTSTGFPSSLPIPISIPSAESTSKSTSASVSTSTPVQSQSFSFSFIPGGGRPSRTWGGVEVASTSLSSMTTSSATSSLTAEEASTSLMSISNLSTAPVTVAAEVNPTTDSITSISTSTTAPSSPSISVSSSDQPDVLSVGSDGMVYETVIDETTSTFLTTITTSGTAAPATPTSGNGNGTFETAGPNNFRHPHGNIIEEEKRGTETEAEAEENQEIKRMIEHHRVMHRHSLRHEGRSGAGLGKRGSFHA